jgi:hypothetical protein
VDDVVAGRLAVAVARAVGMEVLWAAAMQVVATAVRRVVGEAPTGVELAKVGKVARVAAESASSWWRSLQQAQRASTQRRR